jgi:hypothetical protein
MLQVGASLGVAAPVCVGGAENGQSCTTSAKCTAPGTCYLSPFLIRLLDLTPLPFHLVTGGADPSSFATERTGGTASHAPLLLITGGRDAILNPLLATRLADALGMHLVAEHVRRGPDSFFVQWPGLEHNLVNVRNVREQAYTFLASRGRRLPRVHGGVGE